MRRLPSKLPVCALATVMLACACGKSSTRPRRAYVSNETDGTVSVIDLAAQRVIATIHVGKRPRGLHVSRDGHRLYVALSGSPRGGPGVDESKLPPADRSADGIGIVDLDKLELVKTIASGQDPESFDLVGDGQLVVSNEETAEVSLIDVAAGTVRGRVPVGHEPEGVTTEPDGKLVYVTSEADSEITVIDPRAAKAVANIPVGLRPRGIAFTPDGARAFVTNEADASITVIDARARRAIGRIALPTQSGSIPRPMGVALSRDGHRLYVTAGRAGSVAVIDPTTSRVVRMIPSVGARPWGIAIGADGKLYTANGPSNDVAVIDPESGRVLARLAVGHGPWGIAID